MTPPAGQRWTRNKPTEPGWYWWRDPGFVLSGGLKPIYLDEKDLTAPWGNTCEWQGPIAPNEATE